MPRTDPLRLAVLGAGPVGLEAALYARTLGLNATIYERGRVGEHLHRWGHVRLFTPFGMNVTPLGRAAIAADNPKYSFPGDADLLTGREHITAYLDPLSRCSTLRDGLRVETHVVQIGRRSWLKSECPPEGRRAQQPFRLLLRGPKGKEEIEEADLVLDCTGVYGQHRWMGDGGIPALGEQAVESQIAYGLEDVLGERQAHYAGKNVLVVGAGYSAATTICNLATLAEKNPATWVVWLVRGSSTQPIKRQASDPLRERDRLAVRANTLATRGEGHVEFHPQALVEGVEALGPDKGFRVSVRCAGKVRTFEVERIIANVGSTPENTLYRELQVHECYASLGPMNLAAALARHSGADCLTIPPQGASVLRNPEPNFYILGIKSYGRNPHFLLRTGFEQIRDAFTLISGKSDLDLYRKR